MGTKVELGVFLMLIGIILCFGVLFYLFIGGWAIFPYISGCLIGGIVGSAFYVHINEMNDD